MADTKEDFHPGDFETATTEVLSLEQFETLAMGDMFDFGSFLRALEGTTISWVVDAIRLDKDKKREALDFRLYVFESYLGRVRVTRKGDELTYKETL